MSLAAYTRFRLPEGAPPKAELPTMYDLPSEDPEEPGLPDDFHYLQPQLLRETFLPADYPQEDVYLGTDINVYYDVEHPLWHKRPDWFAVLGAQPARSIETLRLSYVVWQEGVSPYLVVELLSPGTEAEDLGRTAQKNVPPNKWTVYEQILQVPFYVLYDRYQSKLRAFALAAGRYRELALLKGALWLPELGLNLCQWDGEFQGVSGKWIRWFDETGKMLPCTAERTEALSRELAEKTQHVEQEKHRADAAEQRAAQLAARLRELGVEE
jgi:Uma2 family endonuclease